MDKSYILVCGKMYDGIEAEFKLNMEILIEGDTIKQVGRNISRPPMAEVIDLSHLTVTPGLIDAHIHPDLYRWQDAEDFFWQSSAWNNLGQLHTAQRTLERGFTTIRCFALSDRDFGIASVKRAINAGYFPGSRMVIACHALGSEASHADLGQYWSGNPYLGDLATLPTTGTGPEFFRRAVRREIKYGSDFIKFFMSGGFSTPNDGPEDQQLSDEEALVIIETAKQMNKTVTAHVYAPPLMQKLINMGITGMEHGSLMDEETARRFEETDTYLVPTFCPYNEIIDLDEENLKKKPPYFRDKLRSYGKRLQEGRKVIANSKIRLGYGTDFVAVHQCYESWYEYQSWMRAGIEPFRILKAATSENARILQLDHEIGSIEPGKKADIAAWHRDLLHDENALSECDFVMKGGVVYPTAS